MPRSLDDSHDSILLEEALNSKFEREELPQHATHGVDGNHGKVSGAMRAASQQATPDAGSATNGKVFNFLVLSILLVVMSTILLLMSSRC